MKRLIVFFALSAVACSDDAETALVGPDAGFGDLDAGDLDTDAGGAGTDTGDAIDPIGPDAGVAGGNDADTPDAEPVAPGCDFANPLCGGENICIANECVSAWAQQYRVWVYDAEVPALNPDGVAWDPNGGAPDLYVSVNIGGAWTYQTDTVLNDFSAEFLDASYVAGTLSPGVVVLFYVADNDGVPGDTGGYAYAFSCGLALSADLLDPADGAGEITCSTSSGTFHGRIEVI